MENDGRSGKKAWLLAAAWVVLLAGVCLAFRSCFAEMWSRWFPMWNKEQGLYNRVVGGESYYTHGPIIPLVSLLIVLLLVRHTKIIVRPSPRAGLAVLLASLFLHLAACFARVNFAQGFALLGVVVGMVLLLWGRPVFRRLWFPVAFLAFMVPLPDVTIGEANYWLSRGAAWMGVELANLAGVVVSRKGVEVFLMGDKHLTIANVCNGLRTLISLLAFGALYAYVCRLRGAGRLVLFVLTVPVAVVANGIRILVLILVADIWDVKTALGWFHDSSGIMIYVLAFLFMFGLERFILWFLRKIRRPVAVVPLFHDVRRGPEDEGQWGRLIGAARSRTAWVAAVLVLLTAGGVYYLGRSAPTVWAANVAANALPDEMTVGGRRMYGQRQTIDRKTLGILETEDYFYSHYVGAGALPVDFCIIFSQDNRKGIHPPEQCLQGSGEGIVHRADLVVDRVPGRGEVPCRELITQSGPNRYYFLYTYKCGRTYTRSFWGQQWTIFANGLLSRDASGALIRISTPVVGSEDSARQWCMEFMRTAIPRLDETLQVQRSTK